MVGITSFEGQEGDRFDLKDAQLVSKDTAMNLVASALQSGGRVYSRNEINKAALAGGDELEASAYNYTGGVILRDDINHVIADFRKSQSSEVWDLMPKEETAFTNVREFVRRSRTTTGYANRDTLNVNTQVIPNADDSDPGEEVVAIVSLVDVSYMEQTLRLQQERLLGVQYDPAYSEVRAEMISSHIKFFNKQLIVGDKSVDSLSMNGLLKNIEKIPALVGKRDTTIDLTDPDHESIWFTLEKMIMSANLDTDVSRRIDTIVCNGTALLLLKKELAANRLYQTFGEASMTLESGVNTAAVWVMNKKIPLIVDPFLPSGVGAGAGGKDEAYFYCYDRSHWRWHGITPMGGQIKNPNLQIFEVMKNIGTGSLSKPLLTQMIGIQIGTPRFRNNGDALYRLKLLAPAGTAFDNNF